MEDAVIVVDAIDQDREPNSGVAFFLLKTVNIGIKITSKLSKRPWNIRFEAPLSVKMVKLAKN